MTLLLSVMITLVCAAIHARATLADGLDNLEAAPPDVDAREVARRAENALRSDRTYMEAEMTIRSPRLTQPRVVAFRSWDDRAQKRSFIRILTPPKDAGAAFLKLHPNLWSWVPRVERTLRIPPSMMLQPWMGSDLTNDDLVNESSEIDDYDHRLLGVDPGVVEAAGTDAAARPRAYVVEYVPHEDAPVVWGKILTWIEVEHGTPLRQEFYDEDGEKLRTMVFSDIRDVGGRNVPHLWSVIPHDKKGHGTVIAIREFRFDETFDDDVFTTRNLKQRK
jgi:outer membrane lipoprotein-sorting protein